MGSSRSAGFCRSSHPHTAFTGPDSAIRHCCRRKPRYGCMTQTKLPPGKPGRFEATSRPRSGAPHQARDDPAHRLALARGKREKRPQPARLSGTAPAAGRNGCRPAPPSGLCVSPRGIFVKRSPATLALSTSFTTTTSKPPVEGCACASISTIAPCYPLTLLFARRLSMSIGVQQPRRTTPLRDAGLHRSARRIRRFARSFLYAEAPSVTEYGRLI